MIRIRPTTLSTIILKKTRDSRPPFLSNTTTRSFFWRSSSKNQQQDAQGGGENGQFTGTNSTEKDFTSFEDVAATQTPIDSPASSTNEPETAFTNLSADTEEVSSSTDNIIISDTSSSSPSNTTNNIAESLTNIDSSVVSDVPIFEPTWYYPQDQMVNYLLSVDSTLNSTLALSPDTVPFAYSIIGGTLLMRLAFSPLAIAVQKNSSRLAHAKPEMDAWRQEFNELAKSPEYRTNQSAQMLMQAKLYAIYKKYDFRPSKSFLMLPFAAVSCSTFFALQNMPLYFTDLLLNQGGILWFPDLSVPDPTSIGLPIISSMTFLATIELSKQNTLEASQNNKQGEIMINVFRGLAVLMIPFTMQFASATLVFFVTNNMYTFAQTGFLRIKIVRKALDIWDPPPKPIMSASPTPSVDKTVQNVQKQTEEIDFMVQKEKNKSEQK